MMYPYGLFSIFAICCTALVGILFISGGFFVPSLRNEQTKYPNGPRPLGFLGNFFTLSRLLSSPDQELLSLARRFGDLCMLWYGSNPVMIINTPRAARDLLTEVCRTPKPLFSCRELLFCSSENRKVQYIHHVRNRTNFAARCGLTDWLPLPPGKTFGSFASFITRF